MGYARVISTIKRNGEDKTVVRVIEGRLTCSKVKKHEDLKKMSDVIGVYDSLAPASWIVDDLNNAGFVE